MTLSINNTVDLLEYFARLDVYFETIRLTRKGCAALSLIRSTRLDRLESHALLLDDKYMMQYPEDVFKYYYASGSEVKVSQVLNGAVSSGTSSSRICIPQELLS